MRQYTGLQTRRPWRGGFNLTPLVDIAFQLIVFFMLVSQVVTAEREPMDLPTPHHSQANPKAQVDRLIINLFADSQGGLGKIKLNASVVPDLPALVDLLLRRYGPAVGAKKMPVILRADRHLRFEQVEPVLKALSNASLGELEIATEQQSRMEGGSDK